MPHTSHLPQRIPQAVGGQLLAADPSRSIPAPGYDSPATRGLRRLHLAGSRQQTAVTAGAMAPVKDDEPFQERGIEDFNIDPLSLSGEDNERVLDLIDDNNTLSQEASFGLPP